MRVIAGSARGRRLVAPKGDGTRPTPDRVREALFSLLAANVPGARVLDLYAGTGALGIEALSRGASHATFVESDRAALAALRQNLAVVPGADCRVVPRALPGALDHVAGDERRFDLIFLDPPFAAGLAEPTLARLAELALLAPAGVAVCEHAGRGKDRTAPSAPDTWSTLETRLWGDVGVTLMQGP